MHIAQCAQEQVYKDKLNANPADVISIYDALCNCDPVQLLNAVLLIEMGHKKSESISSARKDMLLCRLRADLEIMKNLPPNISGAPEVIEPTQFFKELNNVPWPKALAMHVWLPESLTIQERYFILGQLFSVITAGAISDSITNAA